MKLISDNKVLERFDHKDQQMAVRANAVLKVLGKSSLFLLDVLFRESVQNSIDAVSDKCKDYIRYYFDVKKFRTHDDLIKSLSFLEQKRKDLLFQRLVSRIRKGDPVMFLFSDTGTTGLTGPVRRGDPQWSSYKGRKNFENLVYQLGQNHGASGAGGSYGFGKSVYYHLSAAGLVMYYSRTAQGERLIFNMISSEENEAVCGSTGISWWGDVYKHEGVKYSAPLEDQERIKEILTKMGLQGWRFKANETGTLICVIAPDVSSLLSQEAEVPEDLFSKKRNLDAQLNLLREKVCLAVLKWYWPRITETRRVNPKGPLKPLKFFYGAEEVILTKPYEAMGGLLRAAENSNDRFVQAGDTRVRTEKIEHQFGSVMLGTIAYQIIDGAPAMLHLNKILMIRKPRMVVYEAPVEGKPDKSVAALFLVNSDEQVWPNSNRNSKELTVLDDVFRDCESATHSEWNYQDLSDDKKWFRFYVKTAKEKVVKVIQNALNPVTIRTPNDQFSPSAKVLGRLLITEEGGGIQTFRTGRTGAGGYSAAREGIPRLKTEQVNYTKNGIIQFKISALNLKSGKYEIFLQARGGSELVDAHSWKKNMGKEFPFYIISYASSVTKITLVEGTQVQFSIEKTDKPVVFDLSVMPVRRDALISFGIKEISV